MAAGSFSSSVVLAPGSQLLSVLVQEGLIRDVLEDSEEHQRLGTPSLTQASFNSNGGDSARIDVGQHRAAGDTGLA
jgi:hypothetical protein